jgi:hypothetical protein
MKQIFIVLYKHAIIHSEFVHVFNIYNIPSFQPIDLLPEKLIPTNALKKVAGDYGEGKIHMYIHRYHSCQLSYIQLA